MSPPSNMRALLLGSYKTPLTLTEVPCPIPKRGEVLVRIYASSANPLDLKIRAGKADHAKVPLPAILGMDLAGVVELVGPEVQTFKPGDKVFGLTGGIGGVPGSLAEFAAVDSNLIAIQPANFTMRQAAALPLSFITAWEGLVDHAHIRAGQRVLIHAGAGGVGHIAVQVAVALGAKVFATVSPEKTAIVERFGATAINYKTTSVDAYVNQHTGDEGFDVIYDTVGGATLDASFAAVRPYTGHVVSCLGWGHHVLAPLSFRNATYSGVFTLSPLLTGKGRSHHGEILREATKLAEAGKLMPLLNARQYSFETIEDAHHAVESGETVGKVVVEL
jgi:NADPH2:quinone reductase